MIIEATNYLLDVKKKWANRSKDTCSIMSPVTITTLKKKKKEQSRDISEF